MEDKNSTFVSRIFNIVALLTAGLLTCLLLDMARSERFLSQQLSDSASYFILLDLNIAAVVTDLVHGNSYLKFAVFMLEFVGLALASMVIRYPEDFDLVAATKFTCALMMLNLFLEILSLRRVELLSTDPEKSSILGTLQACQIGLAMLLFLVANLVLDNTLQYFLPLSCLSLILSNIFGVYLAKFHMCAWLLLVLWAV